MCHFLEPGHEYAGEAYGGEVVDGAYDLFIVVEGYLELEPFGYAVLSVAQAHDRCLLVGDVVLAHDKVLGANRHAVLEVAFVFIEGVVLVYVLDVGTERALW